MSPAMAAHLAERLWDVSDVVKLIEEWEHNEHPYRLRHAAFSRLAQFLLFADAR